MKVSSKNKIHRTQLLLKSSMGFRKLHSGFLEFTKIHPVRTIPLAFKCSIPESLPMHSCIQTSQFRLIHKKRIQRFSAHQEKFSMSSRHVQILLQASSLCTNIHDHCKTVPKRIPSHSIHEYHCNVLPIHQTTTKMTLQQLDRPIGAVSPEYSSNDRITNSKLIPNQMLAKTLQSRIGTILPKQVPYTIPLQLVCSNMHEARSFPRSQAEKSQYFHILDSLVFINHHDRNRWLFRRMLGILKMAGSLEAVSSQNSALRDDECETVKGLCWHSGSRSTERR